MLNDFLTWKKAYRGPFKERDAFKLMNDITVNPDIGIYGKTMRKAPKCDKYDIYVQIEQKLSTSILASLATSRYNEDIINNNNNNEEKESEEKGD